jgi:hypothetical protein
MAGDGPRVLYVSPRWGRYTDRDVAATYRATYRDPDTAYGYGRATDCHDDPPDHGGELPARPEHLAPARER